jgi:hypothetical protein
MVWCPSSDPWSSSKMLPRIPGPLSDIALWFSLKQLRAFFQAAFPALRAGAWRAFRQAAWGSWLEESPLQTVVALEPCDSLVLELLMGEPWVCELVPKAA